jgi:hypothetical protein
MTMKAWTITGVIIAGISLCVYLFETFLPLSTPATTYAPQTMGQSPGGIQVQGDGVKINIIATYTVVHQAEKFNGSQYQISPTLRASEGILPSSLCLVISADVKVTDIMRNVISLGSSGENTECITSPPREFTPLITLNGKPSFFKIDLINQ